MTDTNQQPASTSPAFTAVPQGQAQVQQPTSPDVAQNTVNPESNQGSIPYDRFQKVIQARKALEDKVKTYEDAEKKRQEEEALKRGEFETVINTLKPQAERATQLENALKNYLESELLQVPAQFKDLLPEGDTLVQLQWVTLAKAKGLFTRTPAPNTDAGATGDPKQALKLSDQEQAMAKKLGITAEQYAKNKRA